tara:strand:+ start:328 stop:834 length:507 start_codon:yes stop_codon:yes gene_type:complete
MARKKLLDALADASAAATAAARQAGREKLRTGEKAPESTGIASKSRVDIAKVGGKTQGMAKRLKEKMRQYNALEDKSSEKAQLLNNAITEMKDKLPNSVVKKVTDSLDMNKGGAAKKAMMMRGGMANGKTHMYAAGGNVTDKLPNKGLKQLAKTAKGKTAVRKMGFDV